MTRKKENKYNNFPVFLTEVCQFLHKDENLSDKWMMAIKEKFGIEIIINIMYRLEPPVIKFFSPEFTIDMLVDHPNIILTNAKRIFFTDGMLSVFRKKSYGFDLKEEKERIKRSEIIYNEINYLKISTEDKMKNIDRLFNDLVSGKDILY